MGAYSVVVLAHGARLLVWWWAVQVSNLRPWD
jgi:hypothetical protein